MCTECANRIVLLVFCLTATHTFLSASYFKPFTLSLKMISVNRCTDEKQPLDVLFYGTHSNIYKIADFILGILQTAMVCHKVLLVLLSGGKTFMEDDFQ